MKKIILGGISLFIAILFLTGCFNSFFKKNVKKGIIIILNGPSAVGKSSIIKKFQEKQNKPWLCMGLDNFYIGVLPAKFYEKDIPEHHSVMQGFAVKDENDQDIYTVKFGPETQKIIRGMHRAIKAYAGQGNNVIVDYIKYDPSWLDDLKKCLKNFKVFYIGVNASLKTIEQRELARKTSPKGHARSHYYSVHDGINYDLELDTDNLNSEQCADKISEFIKQNLK